MAIFSSDEHLYSAMQALFEKMRSQSPNPIDQLGVQRMAVRLRFSNPTAHILVNGRRSPVSIHYGQAAQQSMVRPDLVAEMAADTFHLILLNDLSLRSALANKKIKVDGALWKTNSLADILARGRLLYPQVARQVFPTSSD